MAPSISFIEIGFTNASDWVSVNEGRLIFSINLLILIALSVASGELYNAS